MATEIKRIHKEFLLKALYDGQIPITHLRDGIEHKLVLEQPVKDDVCLKLDQPMSRLKARDKLYLLFEYQGEVISFTAEVVSFDEERLIAKPPEFLYKNLDRGYSRVNAPEDLQIQLVLKGDNYALSFPRVDQIEPDVNVDELELDTDPKNLTGFIAYMASKIKVFASGYKLVIFKDVKPVAAEEHIVAETGKALFLASIEAGFPQSDPYPQKRLILEEDFKNHLESAGVESAILDERCKHFLESKTKDGILSDAWIPVLFREYVVGYIHAWIKEEEKPLFDFNTVDTLYQFAKIIAYSLLTNGFFKKGRLTETAFSGEVIDISVSGMLFACPHSPLSRTLRVDNELAVKIISPKRQINAAARILRDFKDVLKCYFGCQFTGMEPEDARYLYEYLYGRPFAEGNVKFISGHA